MSPARRKGSGGGASPPAEEVVSHLEQAEEAMLARERSWERRVAELEGANRALMARVEEERERAARFAEVAQENAHLHRELEQAYRNTISTLADAVEAKDPYTHGHCEMASRHACRIAERLGLSDHDRAVTCYAALLHDVGKIGVSDGVLNKPGPLLPEEMELVRAHVRVGHDLLRKVPALEEVAIAVLHHHEWYDGSGYPAGLEGDAIPIASRVVAVVDAFGAMVTRRSYKEAYPESYAREELRRFAGRQFDPEVVSAFLAVLDAPGEEGEEEEDREQSMLPALTHLREVRFGLPLARV